MQSLNELRNIIGQIETALTDAVAKVAPWIAPVPTAYLVGRATIEYLHWPWPVATVAAILIESLGLATATAALELREYNRGKRKSDSAAPFWLAASLVGVYLTVAIGLTIALDIFPTLATYAPAIFPILSLTGVTVLALRTDHKRRLEAIEQEKAARKAARNRNRKPAQEAERIPAPVPETVPLASARYTETSDETKVRARVVLAERPGISGSELGRILGRSERLGRKLKAEILPEISGNGQGV